MTARLKLGMLRFLGTCQQPLLGLVESWNIFQKPSFKPLKYGKKHEPFKPTTTEELEHILNKLDVRAIEWREKPRKEKSILLRQCIDTTIDIAEEIARTSTEFKGSYGQGYGEELLCTIPLVSALREYAESLEGPSFPKPYSIKRSVNPSQWIVDVFPMGYDAVMFGGFTGELWIEPHYGVSQGKELDKAEKETEPGVGLVLGAGNQYLLSILDILHVLLMQSRVVVCKMNPVNEYMGPFLRQALSPLVDSGYVEFVYGGEKEGMYLVENKLVKSVHLTGSQRTFDSIVWQGHPKTGKPPLDKLVTAELGCVTPYIILPDTWTPEEIQYHATTVVSGLVNNAGHNCLKAEILVTDSAWPQRDEFLDAIRRILNSTPRRTAYYPGSEKAFERFRSKFPDCEQLGSDNVEKTEQDGLPHPPWHFQTNLSPEEAATDHENWCGVLQEVCIKTRSGNMKEYLQEAAAFVNNKCWGTLSCAVIAKPATQKIHETDFEVFISELKYGTVCINVPGIVGFGLTQLSWGAFGEREFNDAALDIGSGNCKVHNTLFFDHIEKSVVRGPWIFHPHPYWVISNRNLENVAKLSLEYMKSKSLGSISKLLPEAFKG